MSSHLLRYTVVKLKIFSTLHHDPAHKAVVIFYPDATQTPYTQRQHATTQTHWIHLCEHLFTRAEHAALPRCCTLFYKCTSVLRWGEPLQCKSQRESFWRCISRPQAGKPLGDPTSWVTGIDSDTAFAEGSLRLAGSHWNDRAGAPKGLVPNQDPSVLAPRNLRSSAPTSREQLAAAGKSLSNCCSGCCSCRVCL